MKPVNTFNVSYRLHRQRLSAQLKACVHKLSGKHALILICAHHGALFTDDTRLEEVARALGVHDIKIHKR
ncbi:hypothetical protein CCU68_21640 [Pseudomonas gingeri NCPPB 3146 = LMG 5327]|uniref:Uncharacterized protein n=3 Tax=Pseudomonas TaxID=286 RepID=A0A7Y7Y6Q5_9PSED|nr:MULTISPECIES: hypothetical protein [Pseudomonas]NVZ29922.1 hypothetical protein [Pseudomonas gingeri]NVZ74294.1 hypothetical protein [Pseudomonas gingeri]NWC18278.1 hypothetical protein [Pseudomonas gingeri]NWE46245.1 hypothetical protein [Pseudomonas gingeri]NWE68372.1 hypothetical protein [Pseudomonas gingeri]